MDEFTYDEETGETYLDGTVRVIIVTLEEDTNRGATSRAALALNYVANEYPDRFPPGKVLDNLIELLHDDDKRERRRRAALALTKLSFYDAPNKEEVRNRMAASISTIRELAADESNRVSHSVGIRALGFIGLSFPEKVLPAEEIKKAVVNPELRPRNRSRAVRALWQLARSDVEIVTEQLEHVEGLLSYSEEQARDTNHKDDDDLGKHAGWVRSSAAKTIAVVASERPDEISDRTVEELVHIVQSDEYAFHRGILALGELSKTREDIVGMHGGYQAIVPFLSKDSNRSSSETKDIKARGYAVWALLQAYETIEEHIEETHVRCLLAVPSTERTRFGQRQFEALLQIAELDCTLLLNGDYEQAFADATAHTNYATVLWRAYAESNIAQGQNQYEVKEEVREHYERAIELDPENSSAQYNYAALLIEEYDESEIARKHFHRAKELGHDEAIIFDDYNKFRQAATRHPLERIDDTASEDRSTARVESKPSSTTGKSSQSGGMSAVDSDTGNRTGIELLSNSHAEIPDTILKPPSLSVTWESFEREEEIATGGYAEVYRETPPDADRPIAVKCPPDSQQLESGESRPTEEIPEVKILHTEANRWRSLQNAGHHDHIVRLYDSGAVPTSWLALEYMDGGTLADRSDELSVPEILWVGNRIADGLVHAHQHMGVHHDVTPHNILFRETPDGAPPWPKLADWGLAAFGIEARKAVDAYSQPYAASEQLIPDRYGEPNQVTDIYQLGAVLYEVLTGEPRPSPTDQPTAPSLVAAVPGAVDDVLLQALEPHKGDRYPSMAHFRGALERVLHDIT